MRSSFLALFYTLFFSLLFTVNLNAQTCVEENLQLRTQAEVDAFIIDYPDCTEISANLKIGPSDDITNLNGLSNIETIRGTFELRDNEGLTSLTALNLTQLDGSLIVYKNQSLPNLNGLQGLTRIGEDLELVYNGNTFTSNGLNNVKVLGRNLDVRISRNPVFQGLEIDSIYGGIYIQLASALSSMNGMAKIKYLGGKMYVYDSDLNNLDVLSELTSIGGLEIIDNNNGVNINGLRNIEVINGDVRFREGGISGLSNLQSLKHIKGNLSFNTIGQTNIGAIPVLERVDGNFEFRHNNLTNDLKGIKTLKYIGGDMTFVDMANLETITEFNALDTVAGSVRFIDLYYGFENFTGLNDLKFIGGNLEVYDHRDTEVMNGFGSLTQICGNVIIERNELDLRINFPESLHTIGGLLIESNPEVTTIPDLTGINFGKGDLIIRYNPKINSLPSFPSMTRLGGSMIIEQNATVDFNTDFAQLDSIYGSIRLRSLRGNTDFPDLSYVGGNISLERLDDTDNLNFIANLDRINGSLELNGLDGLTTLNDLINIDSIPGTLELYSLRNINTLEGLNNLEYIGEDLILNFLSKLKNFQELENLTQLKDRLTIQYNYELESLQGLHNINPDSLVDLYPPYIQIKNNELLSECEIELICKKISDEGLAILLDNNGDGCNFLQEVECLNYGLSGVVFIDINENGIQDDNESGIPNMKISVSPGDFVTMTNVNGRYRLYSEENVDYTITLIDYEEKWNLTTATNSYTEEFIPGDPNGADNHFGLNVINENRNLEITLSTEPTRCNTAIDLYMRYQNSGSVPIEGQIILTLDDLVSGGWSSPSSANLGNNQYRWTIDSIYPYQSRDITMRISMPSEQYTGEIIDFDYTISTLDADTLTLREEGRFSETVLCSYDPNDKLVNPMGEREENYTLNDEVLQYTVRFQNTGNAPAIDVRIRDTLDSQLDLSTFNVTNSSAPVITFMDGTAVEFLFRNIWLPDSLSNPTGSNGFISYEIRPMDGIENFETIDNKADIIFDFNPAIITNTTSNTIVDELCDDIFITLDTTICIGETYLGLSESTIIIDTFARGLYCDSIHMTSLTVEAIEEIEVFPSYCQGAYFSSNGNQVQLMSDTLIIDTLYNQSAGCIDKIITNEITIREVIVTTLDTMICAGENYNGITESGEYKLDMLNQITFCRDTLYLNLTVLDELNDLCYDGDNDGFVVAVDCDDDLASINPDAIEIPDNGIDEDCDGSDLSTSIDELANVTVEIYPNPASVALYIQISDVLDYQVRLLDMKGQLIYKDYNNKVVDLSEVQSGTYILELTDVKTNERLIKRIVVGK